jgi:hypothetical protein
LFDRSKLTFDARYHRHLYDGKPLIGVTTALGIISKGDALVQWGVNQAVDYLAANLQGEITPEELQNHLWNAKGAWRGKRQEAADIGSQAHAWIESYLRGECPAWPELTPVRLSCEAAVKWLDKHRWQTIEVEKQIYHPALGYAGILDWWALIDGVPSVPDWKTSKHIYTSYRYQTAAYVKALEAETGEKPRDRWILRIDKETGEFQDLRIPRSELAADFRAFKNALELFKREKELKERERKERV